jgi:hypothetical protein
MSKINNAALKRAAIKINNNINRSIIPPSTAPSMDLINNNSSVITKATVNAANNAANIAAKNAPASQSNKTVIILVLVGIGLMALLGLVAFSLQMVNDGKMRTMEGKLAKQDEQNKKLNAQSSSAGSIAATNMKRGDQGPPGIQGPPGPTGGVHAAAGPLLCVGQRKVATPTVGVSDASIIYLDDRRYTPIQYWTLRNNPDGTVSVINKFTGNCMTTNNADAVFSDKCKDPVPLNQKFNWGPSMQLSSADKQNFCVSVDSKYQMSNENMNRYNLDNMKEEDDSNKGVVVSKLLLKKCGEVNDINQTWWVGN